VRRQVAEPEEEGLPARSAPLDHPHGLLRGHVAGVAGRVEWGVGVLREPPIAVDRALVVEVVAVVAIRIGVDQGAPLGPAGRDLMRVDRPVAVQVLADQGGVIAGLPQPDRERVVRVQPVKPAQRRIVVEHPVVGGVLAGEECRPRGAAQRIAGEAVDEGRAPLPDQPPRQRHHLDRGRRLVVGLDNDHVGPLLGGAALGAARPRREDRAEQTEPEHQSSQPPEPHRHPPSPFRPSSDHVRAGQLSPALGSVGQGAASPSGPLPSLPADAWRARVPHAPPDQLRGGARAG
jgi:hypothetical protein